MLLPAAVRCDVIVDSIESDHLVAEGVPTVGAHYAASCAAIALSFARWVLALLPEFFVAIVLFSRCIQCTYLVVSMMCPFRFD